MKNQKTVTKIDRRSFLRSTAAAGAGLAFSPMVLGQAGGAKADDINVALLGAGAQGQVLMNACRNIPGVRFKAVCDIWTAYNQKRVSRMLTAYRQEHNTYVDYQEMLSKEKDLQAVIVATPDFWHSEHTVACLKAGLHVYCEKRCPTPPAPRRWRKPPKKPQAVADCHQRRSNPATARLR
jgi:hypothetical protein